MEFIQSNILLILCALAVIFVVLSILKKAVKLTIVLVVLSFVLGSGGAYVKSLTSKYNVHIEGTNVVYKINDKQGSFDTDNVVKVTESEPNDNGNVTVSISFKSGNPITFDINKTAWKYIAKGRFESTGLEVDSAE